MQDVASVEADSIYIVGNLVNRRHSLQAAFDYT